MALIHAVKPQIYFLKHDETGTVKALLAAGADVNHQEKVNKPTSLRRQCFTISLMSIAYHCRGNDNF